MKLNQWDYDVLYPRSNIGNYESMIRRGRKIARESKCLIYSRGKIDASLLQITQEMWLYSAHRGNIDSDLIQSFDYCLCVDHRLRWWNTDGILNSLGWMEELDASTVCGLVLQNSLGKPRILNYPVFDTDYQGERFHWAVGDLPMKVRSWNNLIAIYNLRSKEVDISYLNPSLVGLI